jgi:hypothetical protein
MAVVMVVRETLVASPWWREGGEGRGGVTS